MEKKILPIMVKSKQDENIEGELPTASAKDSVKTSRQLLSEDLDCIMLKNTSKTEIPKTLSSDMEQKLSDKPKRKRTGACGPCRFIWDAFGSNPSKWEMRIYRVGFFSILALLAFLYISETPSLRKENEGCNVLQPVHSTLSKTSTRSGAEGYTVHEVIKQLRGNITKVQNKQHGIIKQLGRFEFNSEIDSGTQIVNKMAELNASLTSQIKSIQLHLKSLTEALNSSKYIRVRNGSPGPKGDPGIKGPLGPQGPPGNNGTVGPQGPVGNTGSQGSSGPAGVPGINGTKGDQGSLGPQGMKGIKGEKGVKGPSGSKGKDGVPGPPGPPGSGDLSKCIYKTKKSSGVSPSGETTNIDTIEKEPKDKIFLGASCSTEGASEYRFSVVSSSSVNYFKCVCRGVSSLPGFAPSSTVYCILHYWECPLTT